jgi:hypothetical protein
VPLWRVLFSSWRRSSNDKMRLWKMQTKAVVVKFEKRRQENNLMQRNVATSVLEEIISYQKKRTYLYGAFFFWC